MLGREDKREYSLARRFPVRYLLRIRCFGDPGRRIMGGHELAMALRAAYLTMHRRTDSLFLRSGVTADQFVVLAELSAGDALTQQELVSRTSSDPNTLRAMLVLLENRRLIARRPHPTDGRARSVSLTRKGSRAFQGLWRKSEALRIQLLAALGTDEASSLVAQLHRIVRALESARFDPPQQKRRRRVGADC
jgi:DNA-binding MarR family transcriptional regulator